MCFFLYHAHCFEIKINYLWKNQHLLLKIRENRYNSFQNMSVARKSTQTNRPTHPDTKPNLFPYNLNRIKQSETLKSEKLFSPQK